jgi:hypothetical protein
MGDGAWKVTSAISKKYEVKAQKIKIVLQGFCPFQIVALIPYSQFPNSLFPIPFDLIKS